MNKCFRNANPCWMDDQCCFVTCALRVCVPGTGRLRDKLLHGPVLVALDCHWGMRHDLQWAGTTNLWLFGRIIDWDCLGGNGLWAHVTCGNFRRFSEATASSKPRQNTSKRETNSCCRELLRLRKSLDFVTTMCHSWAGNQKAKRH